MRSSCLRSFLTSSSSSSSRRVAAMKIERLNDDVIIYPDSGKHSATIIVMHGLGDTAEGWAGSCESWARSRALEHVKFILPTAEAVPVSMNNGYRMPAWYDIKGLTDRDNEDCPGIEDSISRIKQLIEGENALGLPNTRIALAGFSQGGAMALFAGLQLGKEAVPLAGLLVMSGYLPATKKFSLSSDTKVCHCHGTADQVVRFEMGCRTRDHIVGQGSVNYQFHPIQSMPHTVTDEVISIATSFLSTILPHDEAFIVKPKDPAEMSVKELKAAIRDLGIASKAVGFSEKYEFVNLIKEHYAEK